MVCYARPASLLAVIVAVAWLVFAGPASHFASTTPVLAAVLTATAVAATAAALAFAAFMSIRHRRAAAGGCVNCRFRCQHAMTGVEGPGSRRLRPVTTADRRPPGYQLPGGHSGPLPARSAPVLLPMPEVRAPAPRWPDRPIYRTADSRGRTGVSKCGHARKDASLQVP
jgi:hypothetical protein